MHISRLFCCALALLSLPALAEAPQGVPVAPASKTASAPQVPFPLSAGERQQLLDKAQQLHVQAEQKRSEAATAFAKAEKTCWDRFFVSRCLDQARVTKRDALNESKKLDAEARSIEHAVRKREAAEREARRIAEEPMREAKVKERAEKNRLAREAIQAKIAEKQAETR